MSTRKTWRHDDDEAVKVAGFDGFAQPPVGAGESTGQRIQRIPDNAGHAGTRSIDLGRVGDATDRP